MFSKNWSPDTPIKQSYCYETSLYAEFRKSVCTLHLTDLDLYIERIFNEELRQIYLRFFILYILADDILNSHQYALAVHICIIANCFALINLTHVIE